MTGSPPRVQPGISLSAARRDAGNQAVLDASKASDLRPHHTLEPPEAPPPLRPDRRNHPCEAPGL